MNNGKYGRFTVGDGVMVYAHCWSYEHHVGPIPDGLDIDHLCEVKLCVNPAHLEPVTRSENLLRWARRHASPTCSKGHEFTPENTGRKKSGRANSRYCRACAKANNDLRPSQKKNASKE